jgi:dTDP-4-dehydrorhamnose reductase
VILLLGGSSDIGRALGKLFDAFKVDYLSPSKLELDITNYDTTASFFRAKNFQFVVNCAEKNDIEWCEGNEPQANWINGLAVGNLGFLARQSGARLFQVSTDHVFDSEISGLYTEDIETNPLQAYGRSKLIGEKLTLESRGVVFRVQWVLGHKNNFVKTIIERGRNKKQVGLSSINYGSPSTATYIARNIYLMMAINPESGIIHISHDDYVSKYDCGRFVCDSVGLRNQFLIPVDLAYFGKIERPNVVLSNEKLSSYFEDDSFDSWTEDVERYLGSLR